ncbi:hypothetical protein V3H18_14885 [Methylocystis sp. 9N]|uniref:Uncharacterized protein n=1 Tax=Methylocystis borbori TaxID=3118750 RepID=A0ABU7XK97_9HYPH
MIDIKFTALMDFLAWLRAQYPQKNESGGAEEFVPYEDVRGTAAGKIQESGASGPAATPVEGGGLNAADGRRE